MRHYLILGFVLGVGSASGCVTAPTPTDVCAPNATQACDCVGAQLTGEQSCLQAGQGWTACECSDGGSDDAHVQAADGAGAAGVGVLGGPCATPGERACAGHASHQQLVCGASWTWEAAWVCSDGYLCNPGPGPSVGTCAQVVSECATLQPGATFCLGAVQKQCGDDPFSATTLATCPYLCSAGACVGECVPDATQCSGTSAQKCDASGSWRTTPCPTGACLVEVCSPVCGTSTCGPARLLVTDAPGCCPVEPLNGPDACGLDTTMAATMLESLGVALPIAGCMELNEPGTPDASCPAYTLTIAGQTLSFPGCCRPTGWCGVHVTLAVDGAANERPDFGCVDNRATLDGGGATACTP